MATQKSGDREKKGRTLHQIAYALGLTDSLLDVSSIALMGMILFKFLGFGRGNMGMNQTTGQSTGQTTGGQPAANQQTASKADEAYIRRFAGLLGQLALEKGYEGKSVEIARFLNTEFKNEVYANNFRIHIGFLSQEIIEIEGKKENLGLIFLKSFALKTDDERMEICKGIDVANSSIETLKKKLERFKYFIEHDLKDMLGHGDKSTSDFEIYMKEETAKLKDNNEEREKRRLDEGSYNPLKVFFSFNFGQGLLKKHKKD